MTGKRWLYVIWVLLNSVLFYMSGYPQKFIELVKKLPFAGEEWNVFLQHSDKLFLISSRSYVTYDITEYSLALLVPIFLSHLFRAMRPKKMKYQKPKPIW
jgi:hypothetical protein